MGSEGLAGLSVFLGHAQSTLTAFSQIPGSAWSTSAEYFRDAVNNGSWLRQVLQLYTHCLMLQISQGVICNARHDVTQRCARWLLMSLDRVKRRDFQLTQEFLAQMLAVGRGSVNQVSSPGHHQVQPRSNEHSEARTPAGNHVRVLRQDRGRV
jgi:CRP-like cAMP-binding protein